jgi:hypothetical protein
MRCPADSAPAAALPPARRSLNALLLCCAIVLGGTACWFALREAAVPALTIYCDGVPVTDTAGIALAAGAHRLDICLAGREPLTLPLHVAPEPAIRLFPPLDLTAEARERVPRLRAPASGVRLERVYHVGSAAEFKTVVIELSARRVLPESEFDMLAAQLREQVREAYPLADVRVTLEMESGTQQSIMTAGRR